MIKNAYSPECHFQALQIIVWQYLFISMKFERQRGNQAVPDKYQLTNQEFLTFRNNPVTENSGRTVYSQQFDYRSLDRYEKGEQKVEQNYNFRKNVKNLRSQDKYRQLKEAALLFQMTEENSQSQACSVQRREQLNKQLAKLKKGLKRQQKREALLKEQTQLLENDVQQLQDNNERQRNDIEQLKMILQDNEKNIERMKCKLDEYIQRGDEMEDRINQLNKTLQNQIKTNRSNDYSNIELQKQLFSRLEANDIYGKQLSESIEYFLRQIDNMQDKLQTLGELDHQLLERLNLQM